MGTGSPLFSTKFARRAARNPYAPGRTATGRATPVTSSSFTTAPERSSAGFAPTTATPGSATKRPESLRGRRPDPALAYGALTYHGSHAAQPRRTGSAGAPPAASGVRREPPRSQPAS